MTLPSFELLTANYQRITAIYFLNHENQSIDKNLVVLCLCVCVFFLISLRCGKSIQKS